MQVDCRYNYRYCCCFGCDTICIEDLFAQSITSTFIDINLLHLHYNHNDIMIIYYHHYYPYFYHYHHHLFQLSMALSSSLLSSSLLSLFSLKAKMSVQNQMPEVSELFTNFFGAAPQQPKKKAAPVRRR